eukprot:4577068-Amphidinium_carterae.1
MSRGSARTLPWKLADPVRFGIWIILISQFLPRTWQFVSNFVAIFMLTMCQAMISAACGGTWTGENAWR